VLNLVQESRRYRAVEHQVSVEELDFFDCLPSADTTSRLWLLCVQFHLLFHDRSGHLMRIRPVGRILLQNRACVNLVLPVVGMLFARWRTVQLLVRSQSRLVGLIVVCIVVVFGIQSVIARGIMMLRVVAIVVTVTGNVLYRELWCVVSKAPTKIF